MDVGFVCGSIKSCNPLLPLNPPDLIFFVSRSWQAYTVGLTIDGAPARWGMWIIAGLLLVVWLLAFVLKPKNTSQGRLLFLTMNEKTPS